MRQLHRVISTHADDRDHFELALESMGLFQRENRQESGPELAYRGNSMIWGVHARTRLATSFLAPGATPDTVDYVVTGGLLGFRRLRPTARWRLYRMQLQDDKGGTIPGAPTPVADALPGDPPMVIREFCSPNLPAIEVVSRPEGQEYILPGGPVGNQGAFDATFGYAMRGLPAYRDANNQYGSSAASVTLPVENLIFDLIVHQDCTFPLEPEVLVYGFPHGGMESPAEQTVHNLLPISAPLEELTGRPPIVATPLMPRYSQMVARIFERMKWTPPEFRGWRVQLAYPPMSSRVVVRWPLQERPAS